MVLRDFRRADAEARHARQAGDYALHSVADDTPWSPHTLEAEMARFDRSIAEPNPKQVWFAVGLVKEPDSWVGDCGLWSVNEHQRTAHIGISLSSGVRGKGIGTECLRLLAYYAFRVRDLHRVSLETLSTNEAMRRAALNAGFVQEGVDRESAYVLGERVDEVRFGLLRSEWKESPGVPGSA